MSRFLLYQEGNRVRYTLCLNWIFIYTNHRSNHLFIVTLIVVII